MVLDDKRKQNHYYFVAILIRGRIQPINVPVEGLFAECLKPGRRCLDVRSMASADKTAPFLPAQLLYLVNHVEVAVIADPGIE